MATISKLTPRELEVVIAAASVAQFESADWAKMAKAANMSTPKQARDRWAVIKKKLLGDGPAAVADGGNGEGAKNGKGTKKRKAGDDEEAKPNTKKPRKGRKATPAPAADADADADEEDGVKVEPGSDDAE